MLVEGDKVPDFTLISGDEKKEHNFLLMRKKSEGKFTVKT
jgi:hypothetical protein|tara:strand:+ start:2889 stop:3008 length:120 start_codon:yes stop_codon:yes gene_type:complete